MHQKYSIMALCSLPAKISIVAKVTVAGETLQKLIIKEYAQKIAVNGRDFLYLTR